jgi:hypothetical protein
VFDERRHKIVWRVMRTCQRAFVALCNVELDDIAKIQAFQKIRGGVAGRNEVVTKLKSANNGGGTRLLAYRSDAETGLSDAVSAERHLKYRSNELAMALLEPWWKQFAGSLPICAALLFGVLGEWVDTIAILAIVLFNGLLGKLPRNLHAKS